jgi:hypothetical protein
MIKKFALANLGDKQWQVIEKSVNGKVCRRKHLFECDIILKSCYKICNTE